MARPLKIDTPLGGEVLRLRRMTGREEIGRLFEYHVELESDDRKVTLSNVVGKRMTAHIDLPSGAVRHINGVVTRFAHDGEHGRSARYRAILRPWLWLLTLRAGCRIFQNKSVPDIIQAIFREHGLTDFKATLTGTYPVCEYRVQYRESDFAFVSRLMEEHGIYYFFTHTDGKHTMVLADAYGAHAPQHGCTQVPYFPRDLHDARRGEHIDSWAIAEDLEPGACMLEDFDFVKPKADLKVKLVSSNKLAKAAFEIYDYPGAYEKNADGESLVRVRLEELYAQQELALGEANVRGLAAGALFTLKGFPRDDQNREYLLVATELDMRAGNYESGAAEPGDPVFRTSFSAIDSHRPFRSARTTHRPVVQGPQTAIVVGKAGEEIWTDAHGRVKLQFHWDREGKADEKSSCWVRVSQVWAGGKWGAIHIPRIGQEVIVEFLEGDPDRPIVTGRVYNGDNHVPYALPANQTQSGIKSRSSKGGAEANFNELRFEDKKGTELVNFQAEKDLTSLVKNDELRTVNHDRSTEIKNDETRLVHGFHKDTIKKDQTRLVEGKRTDTVKMDEIRLVESNRNDTVKMNETRLVEANRTDTVKVNETRTVEANRTDTVKGNETRRVEGNRDITVVQNATLTVQGASTETVTKDLSMTVQGAQSQTINKDLTINVSGKHTRSIGKDEALTAGGKVTINGGTEITLKVGAASVTLKASGEIEVKGVQLKINGDAMVTVQAGGVLALKGASVTMG